MTTELELTHTRDSKTHSEPYQPSTRTHAIVTRSQHASLSRLSVTHPSLTFGLDKTKLRLATFIPPLFSCIRRTYAVDAGVSSFLIVYRDISVRHCPRRERQPSHSHQLRRVRSFQSEYVLPGYPSGFISAMFYRSSCCAELGVCYVPGLRGLGLTGGHLVMVSDTCRNVLWRFKLQTTNLAVDWQSVVVAWHSCDRIRPEPGEGVHAAT